MTKAGELLEAVQGHFAVVDGTLMGDTQLIYTVAELDREAGGSGVEHLGFGDFITSVPILLPGSRDGSTVTFTRADGSELGKKLQDAGFSGRAHYLSFTGGDAKKAVQGLVTLLKKKKAKEVKV